MEDEETTRVCGRCKKAVAEANFALHESHCRRFLVLCPDCEENVPRSELQTHREEQHALVRCPKCQKKMEKRLLAEHEEEQCPARVQVCGFCELELTWSDLQEHSVACGSRTELCLDCGRYVRLSDREEHRYSCSDQDLYQEVDFTPRGAQGPKTGANGRTGANGPGKTGASGRTGANGPAKTGGNSPKMTAAPSVKAFCKVCTALIPAEDIKAHEMKCTAVPWWNKAESDSDSDNELSRMDLLSPRFKNLLQDQSEPKPGSSRDQTEDLDELGTCPHCQLILPHTTLRWHQAKCKRLRNVRHREEAAKSYV